MSGEFFWTKGLHKQANILRISPEPVSLSLNILSRFLHFFPFEPIFSKNPMVSSWRFPQQPQCGWWEIMVRQVQWSHCVERILYLPSLGELLLCLDDLRFKQPDLLSQRNFEVSFVVYTPVPIFCYFLNLLSFWIHLLSEIPEVHINVPCNKYGNWGLKILRNLCTVIELVSGRAKIPTLICLLPELEPLTTIHTTPVNRLSQNLSPGADLWDHWVQLIHFSNAKVLWALIIYVPLSINQGSPEKQNQQDVYRGK